MWPAIAGIIQIIAMVLKNKFEADAKKRKKEDDRHAGWKNVIKSGDSSAITAFADKLRS